MNTSEKGDWNKIERFVLRAFVDCLDQEARQQAVEGMREDVRRLNETRQTTAKVEHILWKILGDSDEVREAMDRINRRLRRQAKVDRLLRPWWRFWYGLQDRVRGIFRRREEDG